MLTEGAVDQRQNLRERVASQEHGDFLCVFLFPISLLPLRFFLVRLRPIKVEVSDSQIRLWTAA